LSSSEEPPPGLPGSEASQRNFRAPPTTGEDVVEPIRAEAEPAGPAEADSAAETADNAVLLHCDQTVITTDGRLLIQGWAVARVGIDRVEVELDGKPFGSASYGLERPDLPTESEGIPLPIGFDFAGTIPDFAGGSYQVRIIATSRAGD
jgi:hypothetical protein